MRSLIRLTITIHSINNNFYHLLSAYFVPGMVLRVYLILTPNRWLKSYHSPISQMRKVSDWEAKYLIQSYRARTWWRSKPRQSESRTHTFPHHITVCLWDIKIYPGHFLCARHCARSWGFYTSPCVCVLGWAWGNIEANPTKSHLEGQPQALILSGDVMARVLILLSHGGWVWQDVKKCLCPVWSWVQLDCLGL